MWNETASLLKVLYLLKAAAVNTEDEDGPEVSGASASEVRRQELLAFLGAPASENPFEGVWSQQHFASHLPTQEPSPTVHAHGEAQAAPAAAGAPDEDEDEKEDEPADEEVVAHLAEGLQADGLIDARILMPQDVRGMDRWARLDLNRTRGYHISLHEIRDQRNTQYNKT